MANVFFLRPQNIDSVVSPHYNSANELLTRYRALQEQMGVLEEEYIEIIRADAGELRRLGYLEYSARDIEKMFISRLSDNESQHNKLSVEAKECLEKASSTLGWVKRTFQIKTSL